jgi:hypothetical protein
MKIKIPKIENMKNKTTIEEKLFFGKYLKDEIRKHTDLSTVGKSMKCRSYTPKSLKVSRTPRINNENSLSIESSSNSNSPIHIHKNKLKELLNDKNKIIASK